MKFSLCLSIAAVWLLSGCGTINSTEIESSEIHPLYELVGDSDSKVECIATFRHGQGGSDIGLTDGDAVSCTDGTVTVQMQAEQTFLSSTVEYHGTGLTYNPDEPNKTYTIQFTRATRGETFRSTGSLPKPMVISSPVGATITKGNPITVSWPTATSNGVVATVSYETNTGTPAGFSSSKAADSAGGLIIDEYEISNSASLVQAKIRLTRDSSGLHDAAWGSRGTFSTSQFAETVIWFQTFTFPLLKQEL